MNKDKLVNKLIKYFDKNDLSENRKFYYDNKKVSYDEKIGEWITVEKFEFIPEDKLIYPIEETPIVIFFMEDYFNDVIYQNGNPFLNEEKLLNKFIKILDEFDCDYSPNECYVIIHKKEDE